MIHQHHSRTHNQKNDNSNLKRYLCLNVHSSAIYNSQDMETTQLAIHRWWLRSIYTHTHTHTHIYIRCVYIYIILYIHTHRYRHICTHKYTHTHIYTHTHAHTINIAICSNINWPRKYHTKWIKSDRERKISYDITYMWYLKNNTNEELIYKTQTHRQRK